MSAKILTQEILRVLDSRMPLDIPIELSPHAKRLKIKEIYYLKDKNLSTLGVYGNHIVVIEGGIYFDFDISPINSVQSIISLLS